MAGLCSTADLVGRLFKGDLGLCAAPGLPGGGVALAEDVSFLLAALVDVSVSFEDITVLLAAFLFWHLPWAF